MLRLATGTNSFDAVALHLIEKYGPASMRVI